MMFKDLHGIGKFLLVKSMYAFVESAPIIGGFADLIQLHLSTLE